MGLRGCPLLAGTFILLNTVYLNTKHAILNHRIRYSELTTNVFHFTNFSLINVTKTSSDPHTRTSRIICWRETVQQEWQPLGLLNLWSTLVISLSTNYDLILWVDDNLWQLNRVCSCIVDHSQHSLSAKSGCGIDINETCFKT